MQEWRYFPWLCYFTLDEDYVDLFDLDPSLSWKALVFEWLDISWMIFARGKLKDTNAG